MAERERLMELECDGKVATIVLNRPEKLNAWSWESARQVAALEHPGPLHRGAGRDGQTGLRLLVEHLGQHLAGGVEPWTAEGDDA